jgi:hypothetical protein
MLPVPAPLEWHPVLQVSLDRIIERVPYINVSHDGCGPIVARTVRIEVALCCLVQRKVRALGGRR